MLTETAGLPVADSIADVRALVASWRREGRRTALVPTMGNLHAGHASLVALAARHSDRCVVSVFVNPLQFGAGEDYDLYPRTLDHDRAVCADAGGHLIFAPPVAEMYPDGGNCETRVSVPQLAAGLCGDYRDGHFTGVATVVTKLLVIVQPDIAVFGRKDYQQLVIVRQLVRDLCLPTDIVAAPTVREDDGLALSSRNRYLSTAERRVAPQLNAQLRQIRSAIAAGNHDYDKLCEAARDALAALGFRVDYVEVRDAITLAPASDDSREFAVLAAGRLGRARLIDNVTGTLRD